MTSPFGVDQFAALFRRKRVLEYIAEGCPSNPKLVCIFCGQRQTSMPALAEHFAVTHGAVVAS